MDELDVTGLLPHTVQIKAGGKVYEVTTDFGAALNQRIATWTRDFTNDQPVSDDELWEIMGSLLQCPAKDARPLGFKAAVQILRFLVVPPDDQEETTA